MLPLRKSCGPDSPSLRLAMDNMAHRNQWQARNADAEEIVARNLLRNERMLRPKDPETLSNNIQLADIYIGQRKWTSARQKIDHVMALAKEEYGPHHPVTLRSVNCLVSLLICQKHFSAAEKLQKETLEMLTSILGEEDPRTIASMAQLASIYSHNGQFKQAITLGEHVVNLQDQLAGTDHPDVVAGMNNLAFAYKVSGQRKKAIDLMEDAVARYTKIHGPSHPSTRDAADALQAWRHPTRPSQLGNEIAEYFVRHNSVIATRFYSRS